VEIFTAVDSTYVPIAFLCIFHISLALIIVESKYKPVVGDPVPLQISHYIQSELLRRPAPN